MGSEVALSALGIVATMAGALIWLLKKQFEQNSETLKRHSESLDLNTKAMVSLRDSLEQRDEESKKFNDQVIHELKHQQQILVGIDRKQDLLLKSGSKEVKK